jgi:ribosomal protein L11 methyltransferase
MTRSFLEVRVRLPASRVEAAETALLELGADGTAQELGQSETAEVVGYFTREPAPTAAEVRQGVEEWCRRAEAAVPALEVALERRPFEDWVRATHGVWAAFDATPRLRIAPPWDVPPADGRALLVIEPGQAFGTGTHPTTQGCLELLEGLDPPGPGAPALDVGTGTGILALRAIQLGWAPVFACDHDPVAVEDARRNAGLNRLEASLALFTGEAAALRADGSHALILANLFLNPLRDLAPFFAADLRPTGILIVSGFRAEDAPELEGVLAGRGLRAERRFTREGWAALGLRRG